MCGKICENIVEKNVCETRMKRMCVKNVNKCAKTCVKMCVEKHVKTCENVCKKHAKKCVKNIYR